MKNNTITAGVDEVGRGCLAGPVVSAAVILKKNIGGTTVQTTEAKLAKDKKKSEEEYDARKTKKKGRRKTILTSVKGITKTSADYSLGKPTLLGKV